MDDTQQVTWLLVSSAVRWGSVILSSGGLCQSGTQQEWRHLQINGSELNGAQRIWAELRGGTLTSDGRLRPVGSHYCSLAAELELRREASGQHRDTATTSTSGAKWRGRGRVRVPRSPSLSYLLLAPLTDHSQSETRGQGYSGPKDQPARCRWPTGMEIRGGVNRGKTSMKRGCHPVWKPSCTSQVTVNAGSPGAEGPLATLNSLSLQVSVGAISQPFLQQHLVHYKWHIWSQSQFPQVNLGMKSQSGGDSEERSWVARGDPWTKNKS